jgi:uncharacterized protein
MTAALERLRGRLGELERVVVAFSGGADSAFLAHVAHDTLGRDKVLCATAVSASLPRDEEADCEALAGDWGLRWTRVRTDEFANPAYVANNRDRCYHCKAELMDVLAPVGAREGAVVALGVNVDDLGDHRPGQQAARERGAVFPLVDAGFTKAEVRETSQRLSLRTWDKPAAACLSSRLPYGVPVTIGRLGQVEAAEQALRALGFTQVRVRHYGDTARIEIDLPELSQVLDQRAAVVAAVRAAGYAYVTLDLEGFRSGNLNR